MANWLQSFQHNQAEFRAPPPSPIASGRRSSVANDEFLTEFLHHSLRVPDLVLPEHVSPRQNSKIQKLLKLDYDLLDSVDVEEFDVIARTGCFELVNHGISDQLVRSVSDYAAGVFELSSDKKAVMSRSGDKMYGFVDFHGEETTETGEEFVWCRDDSLRSKMEAVLPLQISNSSQSLEILTSYIEKICGIVMKFLLNNTPGISAFLNDKTTTKQTVGSVCYLYRQYPDPKTITNENYHRYDMIRMLIRGSEHSHTLCVHISNGSEFRVYSKKGWMSYCPERGALVFTIGDQLQRWSEGKYKHVMGRLMNKGGDCVSMAFMYNPPPMKEKTISIGHQVLILLIFSLFYMFYCNCN